MGVEHWSEVIERLDACTNGVEWCRMYPDPASAWAACERGEWMLWIVEEFRIEGGPEVRLLACDFARSVLHLGKPGDDRPRLAVEAAERWAKGDGTREAMEAAHQAAMAAGDGWVAKAAALASSASDDAWVAVRVARLAARIKGTDAAWAEMAPAVRARISGDRIQVAIYSRGEIPDAE